MEAKKIVLIILTIVILAPIVFVGSCFPIGVWSLGRCLESSCSALESSIFYFAWVIGLALAILVCYLVIKKILKSGNNANQSN
jgi:hypothetical protein